MASSIEVYLLSVEDLPFKTYEWKGVVYFDEEVDFASEKDFTETTILLIYDAKQKAFELGANAVIGVKFNDNHIGGTW
jgi:hypothetical protein